MPRSLTIHLLRRFTLPILGMCLLAAPAGCDSALVHLQKGVERPRNQKESERTLYNRIASELGPADLDALHRILAVLSAKEWEPAQREAARLHALHMVDKQLGHKEDLGILLAFALEAARQLGPEVSPLFSATGTLGSGGLTLLQTWSKAAFRANDSHRAALVPLLPLLESSEVGLRSALGTALFVSTSLAPDVATPFLEAIVSNAARSPGELRTPFVQSLASRMNLGGATLSHLEQSRRFLDSLAAFVEKGDANGAEAARVALSWAVSANPATPTFISEGDPRTIGSTPDEQILFRADELASSQEGAGYYAVQAGTCEAKLHGVARIHPFTGELRFTPTGKTTSECSLNVHFTNGNSEPSTLPVPVRSHTPPHVSSIVNVSQSPSRSDDVVFRVTFSEPVTGVDAADFALTGALPPGTAISAVGGLGSEFTVTVRTGSGDGLVRLRLVDDNSIKGASGLSLGGPRTGDGDFNESSAIAIDKTPPRSPSGFLLVGPNPSPSNGVTLSARGEPGSSAILFADSLCTEALGSSATFLADETVNLSGTVADDTSTRLHVRSLDLAGNASECVDTEIVYDEDSTPPPLSIAAPVINSSRTGATAANAGATIDFVASYFDAELISLEQSQVSLTATGTASCSSKEVLGSGSATRTIRLSGCTGDGSLRISIEAATGRDAAGNEAAAAGPSTAVEIRNTPPAPPSALATQPVSPRNNNVPVIAGSTSPFFIVDIYSDANCGNKVGSADADTSGAFRASVIVADNSTTTFSAKAIDLAGNASPCSTSTVEYVEDSVPPVLVVGSPAITRAAQSVPKANSEASISFPITYTGAASITLQSSDVTLSKTGSVACSQKNVTGTGNGSRTVTLSGCTGDGSVSLVIAAGTATDVAGNAASHKDGNPAATIDNSPPAQISALSVPAAGPAASRDVTVTGTAEPSSLVQVFLDENCMVPAGSGSKGSGSASALGAFSIESTAAANTLTRFRAKAIDEAGNASPCSSAWAEYTHDDVGPVVTMAQPSPRRVRSATPAVYSVTFETATSVALDPSKVSVITLSGNATCSGVNVGVVDAITRTVTLSGCSGNGSAGITIAANVAQDAAGNSSLATQSPALEVDNTAPNPPVSLGTSPPSPANNNNPNVVGMVEPNATVTIYSGGACVTQAGTGTASATGEFAIPVTVADNSNTIFKARITDAVGNVSLCSSASVTYVEDSNIPNITIGAPSLPRASQAQTVSFSVTYTGASTITLAPADVIVTGATCSVGVSGATATRTVTLSSCTGDGPTSISLAADTSRNGANTPDGGAGPSATFVVDNTPPAQATGFSTVPASPANQNNPTVKGNAEANASVEIFTDMICSAGASVGSTTANGLGEFSKPVTVADDTTTRFYAKVTDTVGNVSACSSAFAEYMEDSTPPPIAIGAPSSPSAFSGRQVHFTITYTGASFISLNNTHVTLNRTGADCSSVAISGSGNASRTVTLSGCTGNGMVGISLLGGSAADQAGNSALAAGPSSQFLVDNTPPLVAITSPNGGNDWITDATSITLSGTCSTDSTAITINQGFTLADSDCSDGTWATSPKAFGWSEQTVTVSVTDLAGNSASDNITFTKAVALGQPDLNSSDEAALGYGNPTVPFTDGNRFFLADPQGHRILIWNSIPTSGLTPPDIVLGQPSRFSRVRNYGGLSARSLMSPNHVHFDGTRLYVADSGNHRVLIWTSLPTENFAPADIVLGQSTFTANSSNGGGAVSASSLNSPMCVRTYTTKLLVCDALNHRVLIWNSIPAAHNAAASIVLGQAGFTTGTATLSASGLSNPLQAAITSAGKLLVADRGNRRVLLWNTFPTASATAATLAVGQADLTSIITYTGTAAVLRDVTGVATDGVKIFVADGLGNRVLVWNSFPAASGASANVVLGQPDFGNWGPNNGGAPEKNLSFPSGLTVTDTSLFVSDGNNRRVLVFDKPSLASQASAILAIGKESTSLQAQHQGIEQDSQLSMSAATLGTKMAVVDYYASRVLLWNTIPRSNAEPPSFILGQAQG